jgi:sugar O-acyltransferase (sialic acid O-acetyltransferase NeuD family)
VAAKPILVIGGGGHGRVILNLLARLPAYNPIGYVDPKNHGPLLGFPYLGNDEVLPQLLEKHKGLCAAIGVGKVQAESARGSLFRKLKEMGFQFPTIVAPSAVVARSVMLGEGSIVMDGAIIQPDCVVGKLCIINTRASLDHDCILGDDVHVCPGATLSGGVKVADGSLIGVGASVVQYLRISKAVTIGAGAAVVIDCLEPGTYVGVPAKRLP